MKRIAKWMAEALPPPVLAIMFWMLAGLMVVLSMASATNSYIRDVVTAFGAIGQVIFAYLVWRVSREQHRFNVENSKHQHRIEMFAKKSEMLSAYLQFARQLLPDKLDEAQLNNFWKYYSEMALVFTVPTMDAIARYGDASQTVLDFLTDSGPIVEMSSAQESEYQHGLLLLLRPQRKARATAYKAITNETKLHPNVP